jgi:hypothetical protein
MKGNNCVTDQALAEDRARPNVFEKDPSEAKSSLTTLKYLC